MVTATLRYFIYETVLKYKLSNNTLAGLDRGLGTDRRNARNRPNRGHQINNKLLLLFYLHFRGDGMFSLSRRVPIDTIYIYILY